SCHDVHGNTEVEALTVMDPETLCESCHAGPYALEASVEEVMFNGNHAFRTGDAETFKSLEDGSEKNYADFADPQFSHSSH
ncbi:MAG: hypothetical protein H0Z35_11515, partial [Thermoanaerobacteraceae bacterium]|nr:hypothetical protein [Thermoanaerobacteraceae bacterium]